MAKRPRFSRWRRLPPVFRLGEHKMPDPNEEPQRLSLYISGAYLDLAQSKASPRGETVQEYCTVLLEHALDNERINDQVAEIEAKRGALEGLNEIANDPEYLAEWSAELRSREQGRPTRKLAVTEARPPTFPLPGGSIDDSEDPSMSSSARIVLRHAEPTEGDQEAFLACLRRGEPVALGEVADLARALQTLESELVDAPALDRRLGFALHRLAYESQILHTDAWPGVFDTWTVDMIRAVQEAVERILSGQDIRFTPPDSRPEPSR